MIDLGGIDYLVIVFVLISTAFGWLRGFVFSATSLLLLIGACLLGLMFAKTVGGWLVGADPINESVLDDVIGFFCVFAGTYIVGGFIQRALASGVERANLSSADHAIGMLFGLLRGVVALIVLLVVFEESTNVQSWVHQSAILPHLINYQDDVKLIIQSISQQVGL